MDKKNIVVLVCMLMILSAVLPVITNANVSMITIVNNSEIKKNNLVKD